MKSYFSRAQTGGVGDWVRVCSFMHLPHVISTIGGIYVCQTLTKSMSKAVIL
jgi:hypothetical protein